MDSKWLQSLTEPCNRACAEEYQHPSPLGQALVSVPGPGRGQKPIPCQTTKSGAAVRAHKRCHKGFQRPTTVPGACARKSLLQNLIRSILNRSVSCRICLGQLQNMLWRSEGSEGGPRLVRCKVVNTAKVQDTTCPRSIPTKSPTSLNQYSYDPNHSLWHVRNTRRAVFQGVTLTGTLPTCG